MFQLQILAGDEIKITKADALEISGLIDLNEGRQGFIHHGGKVFPVMVIMGGNGDKFAGQIYFPQTVGVCKLVIDGKRLVFQFHIPRRTGNLRSWGFLPGGIPGEFCPNGFLKFHRQIGADGENLRKPELANHFFHGSVTIFAMGFI